MSLSKDIINHPAYIKKLRELAGQLTIQNSKITDSDPAVEAGMFIYDEWEGGKYYEKGDMFIYDRQPGFVRQAHTSQNFYPPFSIGTESLYGARPKQASDGTYHYIYNMKVEIGMEVYSAKDGKLYKAIQNADPLLYDPADVGAIFELVEE